MGRLLQWIQSAKAGIAGAPPLDLTFVPNIAAHDIEGVGEPFVRDKGYVELYLESLRLEQARRFATKFHAVAYSFVALPREANPSAHLTAISKATNLAQLDPESLDHVITVSKQMMGATAYRGGPISLEFGLFSVKSGNVLTPVLDYITKVSSTAGISFVGAIKPFEDLITGGMDLIAGQQQDTALEVGVDTSLNLTKGCVAAIVARPSGLFRSQDLSLDDSHKLLLNGEPLKCGYAVFSLRQTDRKSDYAEIPEIRERYQAVLTAIGSGKRKDARDALAAFRLATVTSPDLITGDADLLYQKLENEFNALYPPGGAADVGGKAKLKTLEQLDLYGSRPRRGQGQ